MSKKKVVKKKVVKKKKKGFKYHLKKFLYKILFHLDRFETWVRKSVRNTIIFLVVSALIIVSLFLVVTNSRTVDKLNSTYLDTLVKSDIKGNIDTSFEDTYKISDMTIYGESLMLYKKTYAIGGDSAEGKNVVLRNVVSGKEYTYTMQDGADTGIRLGELDEGLYEVYIYDQFVRKRVYFKESMTADTFTTMRRNSKVKNIIINADKDYLSNFDVQMDKNYMFLTVTENAPLTSTVDVMIDPSGYVIYPGDDDYIDEGYSSDKIKEYKESYELAKLVKEELEEYGLKVEITRGKKEGLSYYGTEGRVGKGYSSHAKVFLGLFMQDNEEINRPNIVTSAYTTGVYCNYLSYTSQSAGIELDALSSRPEFEPGVSYDGFTTNDDYEYTEWEIYPQLRESGGKATYAGTWTKATENSKYKNAYGMAGILYSYASFSNDDSIEYYFNNKEMIAKTIAKGIVAAFDIEGNDNETTVE